MNKFFNFTYELARRFKAKNKYPSKVHSAEAGNEKIKKLILSQEPFLVSRFGATEINYAYPCVHKLRIPYKFRYSISTLSGVFPLERKVLDQFSKIYYDSIRDVNFLGVWNCSEFEGRAISEQCPNAFLSELQSIEPYYFKNPWSEALAGKKILLVHPFTKTAEEQFKKRKHLFKDKNVLPRFDLQTFKAVQTIADQKDSRFKNWIEALNWMKHEISKLDFDLAILGCGAYGLPLASEIKKMKKQAVHMGGASQILFGIKGKRWENHEISKFFNENWTVPDKEESPVNRNKVEGGCYW